MASRLKLLTLAKLNRLQKAGTHEGIELLFDLEDGMWYARSENESRTGSHYYHVAPSKRALLARLKSPAADEPVTVWSISHTGQVWSEVLVHQYGSAGRFRRGDGLLTSPWEAFYDLTDEQVEAFQALAAEMRTLQERWVALLFAAKRVRTGSHLEEMRERKRRERDGDSNERGV